MLVDNEGLDVGFYVEYESFSFDPIIIDTLFAPSKGGFLESETFVPMIANLDKTFEHIERKGVIELDPLL